MINGLCIYLAHFAAYLYVLFLYQIHTTYHVGLMETDKHIRYFRTALETLSQVTIRLFELNRELTNNNN